MKTSYSNTPSSDKKRKASDIASNDTGGGAVLLSPSLSSSAVARQPFTFAASSPGVSVPRTKVLFDGVIPVEAYGMDSDVVDGLVGKSRAMLEYERKRKVHDERSSVAMASDHAKEAYLQANKASELRAKAAEHDKKSAFHQRRSMWFQEKQEADARSLKNMNWLLDANQADEKPLPNMTITAVRKKEGLLCPKDVDDTPYRNLVPKVRDMDFLGLAAHPEFPADKQLVTSLGHDPHMSVEEYKELVKSWLRFDLYPASPVKPLPEEAAAGEPPAATVSEDHDDEDDELAALQAAYALAQQEVQQDFERRLAVVQANKKARKA